MTLQLIALIALLVVATTGAAWAYAASRPRVAVLNRIAGHAVGPTPMLLPGASWWSRAGDWLSRSLPGWLVTRGQREALMHAGYGSNTAPGWYALARIVSLVVLPMLMFVIVQHTKPLAFITAMVLGVAVGLLAPLAWLEHQRSARQERIRKALPDALDLMLVCVEAGVSLDAAVLRVARELTVVHTDLAEELLMLNRRQNAGMPREDALRGLYDRTGVHELRVLATNINQSERWGTSMSRVLRVDSDTLRRQRREGAEKRAALASTKMVFPLVLLILPALLAVVYGPALLNIREVFRAATQQ